jgi:hypothetical protein
MSAENNEGSAEQTPSPAESFFHSKLLLFLFCLGLPWLLMFLLPRMACAVFWSEDLIPSAVAHLISKSAFLVVIAAQFVWPLPIFVSILSIAGVLTAEHRRKSLMMLAICCSLFLAVWTEVDEAFRQLVMGRWQALERIVPHGQPIIDALDAWHKDKADYPKMLSELVPRYLDNLPTTGLAGYPDFQYEQVDAETPYELFVGLGDPDSKGRYNTKFYYWPSNREKYVLRKFGHRFGDWVFTGG